MRYQMEDLDIREISYVGSPANRRKYIFIKNDGGDKKVEIKLEDLTMADRKRLEIEVEKSLTPILGEKLRGEIKEEFEKSFTEDKKKEIETAIRPVIEAEIREEFSKQDDGVSKPAADIITSAIRDFVKGIAPLSKLVGFGYKATPESDDAVKLEELSKAVTSLQENMVTEEVLAEILGKVKV